MTDMEVELSVIKSQIMQRLSTGTDEFSVGRDTGLLTAVGIIDDALGKAGKTEKEAGEKWNARS